LRPERHDIGVDMVRRSSSLFAAQWGGMTEFAGSSSPRQRSAPSCPTMLLSRPAGFDEDGEPHDATMFFEHWIFNAPLTMKDANRFG
jgi:hypothetical protein